VAIIKKSFPSLPIDFFDVFTDRLRANNFSDERLKDAVSHVIDTCVYPTPTIANFISWDRKFKVLNYEDMLKKTDELGSFVWDNYKPIKFKNRVKKVWIHINDIKQYNIKDEE